MPSIRRAASSHPVASTLIVLALVLACALGVRAILHATGLAPHPPRIEGWMTPRLVARSLDVPPEVMARALGTAQMPGRRMTLDEIAAASGTTTEALADRIRLEADAWRAAQ